MKFFKKLDRKGFTLAEMLIVMAVVVVLAAAAIPAVGNQVETARETNDLDMIRAAYVDAFAQAATDYADGTLTAAKIAKGPFTWNQVNAGWTGITSPTVGSKTVPAMVLTNTYVVFEFEKSSDDTTVQLKEITMNATGATS